MKKIPIYFLMHDEEPNIDSFMRMAHELFVLGFDDDRFQRVMILTPKQLTHFLISVKQSYVLLRSHDNLKSWVFAGFMLRTLCGTIE